MTDRITIRLPQDLKDEAEIYADMMGVSVSEFIRRAIEWKVNQ